MSGWDLDLLMNDDIDYLRVFFLFVFFKVWIFFLKKK